jgi:hypothetical protein
MPKNNAFKHQAYPTAPTVEPQVLAVEAQAADVVDFSRLHSEFGISHIELVHGTFAGTDPFGIHALMRSLIADASPALQLALTPVIAKLEEATKKFTETVTADIANFNESYRATFQEMAGDELIISRPEPAWSSENTHLARAALAVRLLCRLDDLQHQGLDPQFDHVMFWGHSHAGNGMALLTNLLANDAASVEAFFEAAGDALGDDGRRAREILSRHDGPHPMAQSLIIVTFGTPVRYGWDTNGCRQLLHITHHRPFDENQPAQTVPAVSSPNGDDPGFGATVSSLQQTVFDAMLARHGDWVQTFAIAGTDLQPTVNREANQTLGEYLERNLPNSTPQSIKERLPIVRERWKTATRLHADGLNLLIEYPATKLTRFGNAHQSVFGHGVYTRTEWLPTHVELLMNHFQQPNQAGTAQ